MDNTPALIGRLACAVLLTAWSLAARSASPYQIQMSHMIVMLDQQSYDLLSSSPALAALADVEQKATQAGPVSYAGFYVNGLSTYVEFFGERGRLEGSETGDCSMGLSATRAGDLARLSAELVARYGAQIEVGHRVRTTATGEIPWYTYAAFKGDPQHFDIWANELDPGYLASQYPDARIADPLSRTEIQRLKIKKDRPFADLTAMTIEADPQDFERVQHFVETLRWTLRKTGRGVVATGPNVTLTVIAGPRSQARRIDFRLKESMPLKDVRFGSVHLVYQDRRGYFAFGELQQRHESH